jgi:hypothetical protein
MVLPTVFYGDISNEKGRIGYNDIVDLLMKLAVLYLRNLRIQFILGRILQSPA